ncbi:MAG: hypothetical protein QOH90_533 [Actinomycetota bacterium]|nr:hypothetical protein [Actinomycetota bacterium]
MPPDHGRFSTDVAQTAVTNAAIILVNVFTGVLAARLLGPTGRGELAAIQTWPLFMATVAMLGMPHSLVYYCARIPERAKDHLATAITIALASSVVFAAVGYLAMPLLLSAQSASVVSAARWYLLSIPVATLLGLNYHPLRGLGDTFVWNILRFAPVGSWLFILVIFSVRDLGANAVKLSVAYLIARAVLIGPVTAVVSKRLKGRMKPRRELVRPLLKFGIPSVVSDFPQTLLIQLDFIVIAAFLPAREFGLYAVATSWGHAVDPVLLAIATAIFPRVASADSVELQMSTFVNGVRLAATSAYFLLAIAIPLTPFGIAILFGSSFHDATPLAVILLIASAFTGVNGVLEDGLRGFGRPTIAAKAEVIGVAATLVLMPVFVSTVGLTGAAIASLLGRVTVFVILLRETHKVVHVGPLLLFKPTPQFLARLKGFILGTIQRRRARNQNVDPGEDVPEPPTKESPKE